MSFIGKLFVFVKSHRVISGIIIICLISLAFFLRPKPQQAPPTTAVKEGDLTQSVSVTGKIDSQTSVDLTFLTGGKVVFLGTKEGDRVNAFQTMAVLDQRTVQKNLENALVDYSKQRNNFDQTQDNYQDRKPYQALNDAMRRILEDNQYDLDKAVISVELQDLVKQQSVLATPISGVVTHSDIKSSDVNVSPAATMTVVDDQNLVFSMEVDEADIGKIKTGQTVKINIDAFPNDSITLNVGTIDFASHTTSTGGNAYYVKAPIFQNGSNYRLGMNGDAEIIINEAQNTLIIPTTATIDNNYIYVKTNKGFEKRKVELGLQNDTQAEVLSGLKKGDTIILQASSYQPQKKAFLFFKR